MHDGTLIDLYRFCDSEDKDDLRSELSRFIHLNAYYVTIDVEYHPDSGVRRQYNAKLGQNYGLWAKGSLVDISFMVPIYMTKRMRVDGPEHRRLRGISLSAIVVVYAPYDPYDFLGRATLMILDYVDGYYERLGLIHISSRYKREPDFNDWQAASFKIG